MFRVDKSLVSLDGASIDDLADLYVSRASSLVAPDGNPPQLCEALISSFQKNNFISVYICLRLTESEKTIFYVPDRQQVPTSEGARAVEEAVTFLSSYGFSMEKVGPEARGQVVKQLPGISGGSAPSASNSAPMASKYVPPPLEIADPAQVFVLEPTIDLIEYVSSDEIIYIAKSASSIPLPVKGLPAQPGEAYICIITDGGQAEVYAVIRLTESRKLAFFLPPRADNPQGIDRNKLQASVFLNDLGFKMDQVNIRLSPAMLEVVIKNIPFLKKVGSRTRPLARRPAAEDPFRSAASVSPEPFGAGAMIESSQPSAVLEPLASPGNDPFHSELTNDRFELIPTGNSFEATAVNTPLQPPAPASFQPASMIDSLEPPPSAISTQTPSTTAPQEWDPFARPAAGEASSDSIFSGGGVFPLEPFSATQSPFGADGGDISFTVLSGSGYIEVNSPDDVIQIYRSIGVARVAPPGYTAEECYAYICCVRGSGGTTVFAALYLTQSDKGVVYGPDRQPSSTTPNDRVIASAVVFLESIGFMMDVLEIPPLNREGVLASVPVLKFASGLGKAPVAAAQSPVSPAAAAVAAPPPSKPVPPPASHSTSSSFGSLGSWGEMTASPASSGMASDAFAGFEYAKAVTSVDLLDPMDLFDVYRSFSPAAIAPEGFPSQPGEALVCGVNGSDGLLVFIALILTMSRKTLLYLPKNRKIEQSAYRDVIMHAIHFAESIGFIMDEVALPKDPSKREAMVRAIPVFRGKPAPQTVTPTAVASARPQPPVMKDQQQVQPQTAPPAVTAKKQTANIEVKSTAAVTPAPKTSGEEKRPMSLADQLTRILGSF